MAIAYAYLARALNATGLFYIHLVDHSAMGAPAVPQSIKDTFRKEFKGVLILSGVDAARAESDLEVDGAKSDKIKSAVVEVVDDLVDQKDETVPGQTTSDAEAAAAIETTDVAISDLPVLKSEDLAPEWQADTPVLCVAGRGPVDEAAAIMLAARRVGPNSEPVGQEPFAVIREAMHIQRLARR